MLIGEVASKSGVSRDTIRYYERRGLIEVTRRRDNDYKDYAENSPERIAFIQDLQDMGFTLGDTRFFLGLLEQNAATCGNTGPVIAARIAAIDEKIARLQAMRTRMTAAFKSCAKKRSRKSQLCGPIASRKTARRRRGP